MALRANILLIIFVVILDPVNSQYQSCASSWTLYDDVLYFVSQTSEVDFSHARASCQNYGGDLAVIKKREQMNFLFELLMGTNYYWIGLTDIENHGTYRWVDGTYLDTSLLIWGPIQPDRTEHCVILVSHTDPQWDHKWADYGCNQGGVRHICARNFVLPRLLQPPTLQETGTNHALVAWQPWQDTSGSGEGPASGYKIYYKLTTLADADESWTLAGYLEDHGTGDNMVFNVTGLVTSSEYELAITVIHLCTGREGSKGPSLVALTSSKVPDSVLEPPSCVTSTMSTIIRTGDNLEPLHDPKGSLNPIIPWALFGVSMLVNVTCGIIIAGQCLCRRRSKPKQPEGVANSSSKNSGLYNNPTFNKEEEENKT